MADWKNRFITGSILIPSILILVQYDFTIKILAHVVVFLSLKEYQKMITTILKMHSSESEHYFIDKMGSDMLVFVPPHLTMFVVSAYPSETLLHVFLLLAVGIYSGLRINQFVSYIYMLIARGKESFEKDPYLEKKAFILAFLQMAADVFGFLAFAYPLNYAFLLLNYKDGIGYILLWLIAAWQTDNGALFIGSLIGKTKFSPLISPKKTWEGVSGGVFLSVVSVFIFSLFKREDNIYVPFIATKHYLFISVIIACASIFGDFIESFIKRAANQKDSGTLLPGHGGMLDRMDSLVLTAPVVYFYGKLVIGIF